LSGRVLIKGMLYFIIEVFIDIQNCIFALKYRRILSMKIIYLIVVAILLSSCGIIKNSPKNALVDGTYNQLVAGKKIPVYIQTMDDSISILNTKTKQIFSPNSKDVGTILNFHKQSFDIDFITVPVKFRPSVKSVPNQLSGEINASLYLGLRNDLFKIKHIINPLGTRKSEIEHFGISFGGLLGVGNSVINADATNQMVVHEYQGIVFSKGLAGIIAINNFTIGIAFGSDNLIDSNQNSWIYNQKPWFGLAIGLNLN